MEHGFTAPRTNITNCPTNVHDRLNTLISAAARACLGPRFIRLYYETRTVNARHVSFPFFMNLQDLLETGRFDFRFELLSEAVGRANSYSAPTMRYVGRVVIEQQQRSSPSALARSISVQSIITGINYLTQCIQITSM